MFQDPGGAKCQAGPEARPLENDLFIPLVSHVGNENMMGVDGTVDEKGERRMLSWSVKQ